MTFSDFATMEFELDDHMDIDGCMGAIEKAKYRVGTTNTADVLKLVREQMFHPSRGGRDDRRHILVLFTDGGSNDFKVLQYSHYILKINDNAEFISKSFFC